MILKESVHILVSIVQHQGGDYTLTKGDKKLTVTIVGCRLRNYVSGRSITIENENSVVQVVVDIDKHENLYNYKLSQKHAT